MKCKLMDGLDLISNVNVTDWHDSFEANYSIPDPCIDFWPWSKSTVSALPSGPSFPELNPRPRYSAYANFTAFEWMRSAAAVYDGPGESRVKLDVGTFVSAYGRPGVKEVLSSNTREHRLTNITRQTAEALRSDVESFFLRDESGVPRVQTTGTDWRGITDIVITAYATRLREILAHLNSAVELGTPTPVTHARMLLSALLLPHYSFSADSTFDSNVARCAASLVPSLDPALWSASERKTAYAIRFVHHTICSTLIAASEALEARHTGAERTEPGLALIASTRDSIAALMQRLQWTVWKDCDRKCGIGEVCMIPVWPWHGAFCSSVRVLFKSLKLNRDL